MLSEHDLILCTARRDLQALHLQCEMGAQGMGSTNTRKLLRCLEGSAALRAVSVTRGAQVRTETGSGRG